MIALLEDMNMMEHATHWITIENIRNSLRHILPSDHFSAINRKGMHKEENEVDTSFYLTIERTTRFRI